MNTSNDNQGADPEWEILLGQSPPPDMLFPVLRHMDHEGSETDVTFPFCGDLTLRVVVNTPTAMRMLRNVELTKLGMSHTECCERALANLMALWQKDGYALEMGREGVGQLQLPETELSSGLLCARPTVEWLLQTCGGRVFASIPRRHVVLIARGDDEAANALRWATDALFEDGEGRPISNQIFACTGIPNGGLMGVFRKKYQVPADPWQLVEFD